MSFTFPQFSEPTAIDAQRSWTAGFESYDQRKDDIYYVVTLWEGQRQTGRFIVVLSPWSEGDDWREPGFAEYLRREIHRLAVTGKTNTDYLGAMSRPSDP
jgi:hypothetical protein